MLDRTLEFAVKWAIGSLIGAAIGMFAMLWQAGFSVDALEAFGALLPAQDPASAFSADWLWKTHLIAFGLLFALVVGRQPKGLSKAHSPENT